MDKVIKNNPIMPMVDYNRVSKAWRTIAIIMTILFLAESMFLIYSYQVGVKYESDRAVCSNNICGPDNYDSFIFDPDLKICSCYRNGEVELQKYIP